MRIAAIIHAPFEELGCIAEWAESASHQIQEYHIYADQCLPNHDDFDALISMGGPQSVLDYQQHHYLIEEIRLLKQALAAEKRILGFCLGAQLIGVALGAAAAVSPHKEIGVWPITLTDAGRDDPMLNHCPEQFAVGHWHGDMMGLTVDAELLASSAGCPRQIVRYAKNVYGFQCHMEFNQRLITEMLKHCAEDLQDDDYIQTAEQLLKADYAGMNNYLKDFLQKWAK